MVRPEGARDKIAGPDTPAAPFPLKLRGPVIKGFGRGSKDVRFPYSSHAISNQREGLLATFTHTCILPTTPKAIHIHTHTSILLFIPKPPS